MNGRRCGCVPFDKLRANGSDVMPRLYFASTAGPRLKPMATRLSAFISAMA
jgi:hypothetical protein